MKHSIFRIIVAFVIRDYIFQNLKSKHSCLLFIQKHTRTKYPLTSQWTLNINLYWNLCSFNKKSSSHDYFIRKLIDPYKIYRLFWSTIFIFQPATTNTTKWYIFNCTIRIICTLQHQRIWHEKRKNKNRTLHLQQRKKSTSTKINDHIIYIFSLSVTHCSLLPFYMKGLFYVWQFMPVFAPTESVWCVLAFAQQITTVIVYYCKYEASKAYI